MTRISIIFRYGGNIGDDRFTRIIDVKYFVEIKYCGFIEIVLLKSQRYENIA